MGKGMKAGKKTGPKPKQGNMQAQLQRLQAIQAEMEETQRELASKEYEVTSGGGVVSAKFNGNRELLELHIEPSVVDPEDVSMLEDLIIAAVNEGIRTIDDDSQEEMGKLTGGLGI